MKSRALSLTSKLIGRQEVWELITDIDRWSEWDFNIERSGYFGSKDGEKRLFKLKHHHYFITATGVVEECVRYEHFRFRIRLAGATLCRKYVLEDTDEGLRITIITSVSGFFSWLWNVLVVHRIVSDTPEDLTIIVEQIKNRYEKQCTF